LLLPYLFHQASQVDQCVVLLLSKLGLDFDQVKVRVLILQAQAFEELLEQDLVECLIPLDHHDLLGAWLETLDGFLIPKGFRGTIAGGRALIWVVLCLIVLELQG
jgi:hypothetical protein